MVADGRGSWPDATTTPTEFGALADRTRAAFNEHYVARPTARSRSDAPTVYALAIAFGLLDDDDRQPAGDRLAELVAENGYRIATGFAGTPFITDALTATGHLDEAYRLLLAAELPVVALPGDHGRDHDLGALGLDAARRHHQPRRDDQLQPLRPRRRRRLDAPHHRRHRPARARLPPRPSRPGPAAASPGRRPAWRPCTGSSARCGASTATSSRSTSSFPPASPASCRCPANRTSRPWARRATGRVRTGTSYESRHRRHDSDDVRGWARPLVQGVGDAGRLFRRAVGDVLHPRARSHRARARRSWPRRLQRGVETGLGELLLDVARLGTAVARLVVDG